MPESVFTAYLAAERFDEATAVATSPSARPDETRLEGGGTTAPP